MEPQRKILIPAFNQAGKVVGYSLFCQGCKTPHLVYVDNPGGPKWKFNGDLERPTFTPSLLVYAIPATENWPGSPRCHSFITGGQMQFLGDSTHALAGKTVALQPWSWEDL